MGSRRRRDRAPPALREKYAVRDTPAAAPRHALAEGILPHLTTRSWNRAPREGESYAYATIGFEL
ncbi:hypothetical protein [Streptomyces sp. NRRL S-37]|uniref:hypothetical protein n=1 Tax=Streptomyces sp. NRRL S-37 TaxID=1463903 RepID=UPI00099D6D0B|nr:hypothetical protein [Streptomyces sp. NRRL S-37]